MHDHRTIDNAIIRKLSGYSSLKLAFRDETSNNGMLIDKVEHVGSLKNFEYTEYYSSETKPRIWFQWYRPLWCLQTENIKFSLTS